MRYPLHRLLLPLALLFPQACSHPQTPSSIARTERPALPNPPAELQQTERLAPVVRGDFPEYVERHGEAAAAVERDNTRLTGWARFYACVRQALATGSVADTCK